MFDLFLRQKIKSLVIETINLMGSRVPTVTALSTKIANPNNFFTFRKKTFVYLIMNLVNHT